VQVCSFIKIPEEKVKNQIFQAFWIDYVDSVLALWLNVSNRETTTPTPFDKEP